MEIIRLNNQAATLASHGRQEEAAVCLQHALAALRDNVEMVDKCDHSSTDADTHVCDPSISCCQKQDIEVVSSCESKCAFPMSEPSIESAFEFYDKIFLVSLDEAQLQGSCSHQSQKRQNLILAIITYNLGNISQQLAMKSGQAWHFKKAMRFYDLSFSTVENILQDYAFDENLVLLLCSLYNNMGYIHARAKNHQETMFCLHWLQRTVFSEEFSNAPMSDDDYCFFSLYITFSSDRQFSCSPAA